MAKVQLRLRSIFNKTYKEMILEHIFTRIWSIPLLGRRPSSAVVAPHRFATAGRRCLLVRLESLDRARFQKDQGGRVAMAPHPDDRSRAGRASLARHRHRHRDVVVACRRRRGRSSHPDRDVSVRARFAPTTRPMLAVGRRLPPWLVVDRGRTLQSSAVTSRPRLPGTLARPVHVP